jgi:hypothetical protein
VDDAVIVSDEFELIVPLQFLDDVRDVSIEPDAEVIDPVPGSDGRVLDVPFHPAEGEEIVPLYELDIEVSIPAALVSDEFVPVVENRSVDEVWAVLLIELDIEVSNFVGLVRDESVIFVSDEFVLAVPLKWAEEVEEVPLI